MMNKKYRVKNTKTGNFVSGDLSPYEATKLCGELTLISDWYEVVDVEETVGHKEQSAIREMTEDEIKGVRALQQVKNIYQAEFRDSMLVQILTGSLKITDKQAGYLWFLVYRYRRNFNDQVLISTAEKLKATYASNR